MSLPRKRLKNKTEGVKKANGEHHDLPRKKKQTPAWVKAAADRAEKRSQGDDPWQDPPKPSRVRMKPERLEDEPEPATPIVPEAPPKSRSSLSGFHRSLIKMAATYDPEYHPKAAAEMVLHGATERDLIVAFQITKTVLSMWLAQHPEFAASCSITKQAALADERVVRSVYEMANGYTLPETKVFVHKGEVIKVPVTKHIPKDINAAKYWLMNRDPTRWGKSTDNSSSNDGLPASINIQMIRGMTTEQIRQTMSVLKQVMQPNNTLSRLDEMNINNDAEVLEGEFAEVKDGEQKET